MTKKNMGYCPLCKSNTNIVFSEDNTIANIDNCPICGTFSIQLFVLDDAEREQRADYKVKLSFFCHQHRDNNNDILINEGNFRDILEQVTLPSPDVLYRKILVYIYQNNPPLGSLLNFKTHEIAKNVFSRSGIEVKTILDELAYNKLIDFKPLMGGDCIVQTTMRGYEAYSDLMN